ncbi:PLP-dependent aminotransferase family protein [Bacteroidota bacterium]
MDIKNLLASRTNNMKASAIREILKLAADPKMISLGGGLPSPDSFPMDIFMDLMANVKEKYNTSALQYDATHGFKPLREALVEYLNNKKIPAEFDNVLISSGSQGMLDTVGKILISKGDLIAVEAPTYLGALQAFNAYEPQYVKMDMDEDGLIPESMEEVIKNNPVKFVYVVPTFQNPTGRTITLERRKKIAEIIQKYGKLLIEDDPYSQLRFRGEELPTIKSMAPDNVLYTSTFSKIFAPGLRCGFSIAPIDLGRWMVIAKQGIDLHTSPLTQAVAAEYLIGGYLPDQIKKIVGLYQPKQEAMFEALEENCKDCLTYEKADGGMFFWGSGPEGLDMELVNTKCVENGVGFVPGKFFFTEPGAGIETIRLNYTNVTIEEIKKAIKVIGDVLKEMKK